MRKMGINRHLVVADTEAAARKVARPATVPGGGTWSGSGRLPACRFREGVAARGMDELQAHGHAIALTPARSATISPPRSGRRRDLFRVPFAFGTITHDEAMRSVELFAAEVMPALA